MGIDGNMSGDGLLKGGLLVLERGGKVLYSFVQEGFSDHASNEDILKVFDSLTLSMISIYWLNFFKALNLKPDAESSGVSEKPSAMAVECTEDVCAMPSKK